MSFTKNPEAAFYLPANDYVPSFRAARDYLASHEPFADLAGITHYFSDSSLNSESHCLIDSLYGPQRAGSTSSNEPNTLGELRKADTARFSGWSPVPEKVGQPLDARFSLWDSSESESCSIHECSPLRCTSTQWTTEERAAQWTSASRRQKTFPVALRSSCVLETDETGVFGSFSTEDDGFCITNVSRSIDKLISDFLQTPRRTSTPHAERSTTFRSPGDSTVDKISPMSPLKTTSEGWAAAATAAAFAAASIEDSEGSSVRLLDSATTSGLGTAFKLNASEIEAFLRAKSKTEEVAARIRKEVAAARESTGDHKSIRPRSPLAGKMLGKSLVPGTFFRPSQTASMKYSTSFKECVSRCRRIVQGSDARPFSALRSVSNNKGSARLPAKSRCSSEKSNTVRRKAGIVGPASDLSALGKKLQPVMIKRRGCSSKLGIEGNPAGAPGTSTSISSGVLASAPPKDEALHSLKLESADSGPHTVSDEPHLWDYGEARRCPSTLSTSYQTDPIPEDSGASLTTKRALLFTPSKATSPRSRMQEAEYCAAAPTSPSASAASRLQEGPEQSKSSAISTTASIAAPNVASDSAVLPPSSPSAACTEPKTPEEAIGLFAGLRSGLHPAVDSRSVDIPGEGAFIATPAEPRGTLSQIAALRHLARIISKALSTATIRQLRNGARRFLRRCQGNHNNGEEPSVDTKSKDAPTQLNRMTHFLKPVPNEAGTNKKQSIDSLSEQTGEKNCWALDSSKLQECSSTTTESTGRLVSAVRPRDADGAISSNVSSQKGLLSPPEEEPEICIKHNLPFCGVRNTVGSIHDSAVRHGETRDVQNFEVFPQNSPHVEDLDGAVEIASHQANLSCSRAPSPIALTDVSAALVAADRVLTTADSTAAEAAPLSAGAVNVQDERKDACQPVRLTEQQADSKQRPVLSGYKSVLEHHYEDRISESERAPVCNLSPYFVDEEESAFTSRGPSETFQKRPSTRMVKLEPKKQCEPVSHEEGCHREPPQGASEEKGEDSKRTTTTQMAHSLTDTYGEVSLCCSVVQKSMMARGSEVSKNTIRGAGGNQDNSASDDIPTSRENVLMPANILTWKVGHGAEFTVKSPEASSKRVYYEARTFSNPHIYHNQSLLWMSQSTNSCCFQGTSVESSIRRSSFDIQENVSVRCGECLPLGKRMELEGGDSEAVALFAKHSKEMLQPLKNSEKFQEEQQGLQRNKCFTQYLQHELENLRQQLSAQRELMSRLIMQYDSGPCRAQLCSASYQQISSMRRSEEVHNMQMMEQEVPMHGEGESSLHSPLQDCQHAEVKAEPQMKESEPKGALHAEVYNVEMMEQEVPVHGEGENSLHSPLQDCQHIEAEAEPQMKESEPRGDIHADQDLVEMTAGMQQGPHDTAVPRAHQQLPPRSSDVGSQEHLYQGLDHASSREAGEEQEVSCAARIALVSLIKRVEALKRRFAQPSTIKLPNGTDAGNKKQPDERVEARSTRQNPLYYMNPKQRVKAHIQFRMRKQKLQHPQTKLLPELYVVGKSMASGTLKTAGASKATLTPDNHPQAFALPKRTRFGAEKCGGQDTWPPPPMEQRQFTMPTIPVEQNEVTHGLPSAARLGLQGERFSLATPPQSAHSSYFPEEVNKNALQAANHPTEARGTTCRGRHTEGKFFAEKGDSGALQERSFSPTMNSQVRDDARDDSIAGSSCCMTSAQMKLCCCGASSSQVPAQATTLTSQATLLQFRPVVSPLSSAHADVMKTKKHKAFYSKHRCPETLTGAAASLSGRVVKMMVAKSRLIQQQAQSQNFLHASSSNVTSAENVGFHLEEAVPIVDALEERAFPREDRSNLADSRTPGHETSGQQVETEIQRIHQKQNRPCCYVPLTSQRCPLLVHSGCSGSNKQHQGKAMEQKKNTRVEELPLAAASPAYSCHQAQERSSCQEVTETPHQRARKRRERQIALACKKQEDQHSCTMQQHATNEHRAKGPKTHAEGKIAKQQRRSISIGRAHSDTATAHTVAAFYHTLLKKSAFQQLHMEATSVAALIQQHDSRRATDLMARCFQSWRVAVLRKTVITHAAAIGKMHQRQHFCNALAKCASFILARNVLAHLRQLAEQSVVPRRRVLCRTAIRALQGAATLQATEEEHEAVEKLQRAALRRHILAWYQVKTRTAIDREKQCRQQQQHKDKLQQVKKQLWARALRHMADYERA